MSVTSGVGLIPQAEKFGREIAGDSYKNYIVIKKYDFAYNKSATKRFPEGYISMLREYDTAAVFLLALGLLIVNHILCFLTIFFTTTITGIG